MARSQFTFTFPNALPGAPVTFSAAVYSSKVDATADGPTLALDSQRTVAVWTDAAELTATWVDGAGASIMAEASLARPIVTATGGVPGTAPTAASSAPLQLFVAVSPQYQIGGSSGPVVLREETSYAKFNSVSGTQPVQPYQAGDAFTITISPPLYAAGVLTLDYAELCVISADGTNRLTVGRYAPHVLTGDGVTYNVVFDDNNVSGFGNAGTDLSLALDNASVVTAAGGRYQVSWYAQFFATGLSAT